MFCFSGSLHPETFESFSSHVRAKYDKCCSLAIDFLLISLIAGLDLLQVLPHLTCVFKFTFTTACRYSSLDKSAYVSFLGFGLSVVTRSSSLSNSATTAASTAGFCVSMYLQRRADQEMIMVEPKFCMHCIVIMTLYVFSLGVISECFH